MSANAHVLRRAEIARSEERETAEARVEERSIPVGWSCEGFAKEQIRALARRVFLSSAEPPCRHVLFSPAEGHCDVSGMCGEIALALSLETQSTVAFVRAAAGSESAFLGYANGVRPIKSCSEQLSKNLWRVPIMFIQDRTEKFEKGPHWPSFLGELRNEFEYAVIQSPVTAVSSDTAFIGQFTDGIVLVLSAQTTRKATAQSIKEMLRGNRSRILGTVLRDRTFPIPEAIYQRL